MTISRLTNGTAMTRSNFYATINLDRAANQRTDSEWLANLLRAPQSRVLPLWRSQSLFTTGDELAMVELDIGHIETLSDGQNEPILLGLIGETAYFSLDVSHIENPADHDILGQQGQFADLRQVGPVMARDVGNLLAYARGIDYWHQRHRHCGVCGAATRSEAAGHQRRCTNEACNATHFPRTDTACIVLTTTIRLSSPAPSAFRRACSRSSSVFSNLAKVWKTAWREKFSRRWGSRSPT